MASDFYTLFLLAILFISIEFTESIYNIKTKKLIFECKTKECEKSISMYGDKDSFIMSSKENMYLQLQDNKTIISNLNVYGIIHTTGFNFFENTQWKLFHLNTFDKNDKSWNPSEISSCGNSPDTFLGGPCKFGATVANTTITNLPKHNELNIKLRIHFFDEWNNDSIFVEADKKTVWSYSYKSCPSEKDCNSGIDVCGNKHPDRLSMYKFHIHQIP